MDDDIEVAGGHRATISTKEEGEWTTVLDEKVPDDEVWYIEGFDPQTLRPVIRKVKIGKEIQR